MALDPWPHRRQALRTGDLETSPNVMPILNENGDFDFKIVLDYNPFIPDTIPLLNSVSVLRFGQYF